jgi:hypothetical protein
MASCPGFLVLARQPFLDEISVATIFLSCIQIRVTVNSPDGVTIPFGKDGAVEPTRSLSFNYR